MQQRQHHCNSIPMRSRSAFNFDSLSDREVIRVLISVLISERNLLGWSSKDRSSGVVINQREKSIGRHQQMDVSRGVNSGVPNHMCKVLHFSKEERGVCVP